MRFFHKCVNWIGGKVDRWVTESMSELQVVRADRTRLLGFLIEVHGQDEALCRRVNDLLGVLDKRIRALRRPLRDVPQKPLTDSRRAQLACEIDMLNLKYSPGGNSET